MRIYVVRRGDSLYSIAKAAGVSVQTLARINAVSDASRLCVGQAIVVPDGALPDRETEISGYAYPSIGSRQLEEILPRLTYLCPFSWRIDSGGGITPIADEGMISDARRHGCAALLTLTNIGSNGGS